MDYKDRKTIMLNSKETVRRNHLDQTNKLNMLHKTEKFLHQMYIRPSGRIWGATCSYMIWPKHYIHPMEVMELKFRKMTTKH